jgi:hypothetical protein
MTAYFVTCEPNSCFRSEAWVVKQEERTDMSSLLVRKSSCETLHGGGVTTVVRVLGYLL